MLLQHRLSPYLAIFIITLVGAGATLMLVRTISAADTAFADLTGTPVSY